MSTVPLVSFSTPSQIAASVPHMVGYVPTDSVVIVCLNERSVVVTARFDAPPLELAHEAPEWALDGIITPVSQKAEVTGILVVGYDETGIAAARAVATSDLITDRVEVLEALGIDGVKWQGLACPDGCSGCDGIVDYGDPITAAFVANGSAASAVTRSDIEAQHTPVPIDLPDVDPSTTQAKRGWANILTGQWSPEDLAFVSVEPSPMVRDAFIIVYVGVGVKAMSDPLDDVEPGAVEWARSLPPLPQDTVVANLLGAAVAGNTPILWSAYANLMWRTGNGTPARIALENALAVDPEYRLALLTMRLVDAALPFDCDHLWVRS